MNLRPLLVSLCLAALAAAGCAPYKMEIQQGNLITEDALAQIRPGLTKREVRYLLGTPLVVDPFRDDRWDYYYYRKRGRFSKEEKHTVTLFFEGDRVARIEGLEDALTGLASSAGRRPSAAEGAE